MFTWYSFFRNQRGGFRMELIKINDEIMFTVLSQHDTAHHTDINFSSAKSQFKFSKYVVIMNKPDDRGNGKYKDIKPIIEAEYGELDFTKDNLIIFYK